MSLVEITKYDEAYRFISLYSFKEPYVITVYCSNTNWFVSTHQVPKIRSNLLVFEDEPKAISYIIETTINDLNGVNVESFINKLTENKFYDYVGEVSEMPAFDGDIMYFEYWKNKYFKNFVYCDNCTSIKKTNFNIMKNEFDKLREYSENRKFE